MTTTTPSSTHPAAGEVPPLPRPEYPRPDRDRSARWVNLNGTWDLEAEGTTAPITVPFAWETEASGVGRTWLEDAVYSRSVTAPADWQGSRIVLCFGAVHHRARISIDGRPVGEHVGGHSSFEFDVTDHLAPGQAAQLRVEVHAPADKRAIPHGKQRSIPRDDYDGVSFTPTSGIWQTVWLEARGRSYAEGVSLRGDSLTGLDIEVTVVGDAHADVPVSVGIVGSDLRVDLRSDAEGTARGRLEIPDPRLWSPADPHLYAVEVLTGDDAGDRLLTSAGLRRIEADGEELWLNGERLYVRGVLDQGYWPTTGLTAPDEASLRGEIALAAELGYNLVRKHLKFEEPIWLHEADVAGMLVWAEPPCPSRFSPESARAFEEQIPAMVERDGNHPSIIIWGLYNEEWGLDWDIPGSPERAQAAIDAYEALRALDSTRPIVENSGWAHVRTDLVDWHYYEPDLALWSQRLTAFADGSLDAFPVRLGPDFVVDKSFYASAGVPREGLPILNSEYGEGFTSLERAWHLRWETQELRRHDRFAGYVYTEFTDVEHECAGLLTTARRPKDMGGMIARQMNAETVIVMDLIPERAGADIAPPSAPFELFAHISHHGAAATSGTLRAAWIAAGTPMDRALPAASVTSEEVTVQPFRLTPEIALAVPACDRPARLAVWFEDAAGAVLARTFLDAAEIEPPNRRGARA